MADRMSALQPMLDKLASWRPLSAADRAAILSLPHVVRSFDKHEFLVRERDEATHSCVMLSGYSTRHKTVAGGGRQIVAIHMKGDLVDLQNSFLGTADHSVQMLSSGEVAKIPREALGALAMERPRVGMAMWHDTLVDGSVFREWITNVGRRDAHTRVAHLLCEVALRLKIAELGEPVGYELPMSQDELADAVGLTPVHVNRTLKALEREGLISRPSSRSIIIANWNRLAAAADFDGTYLHLPTGRPALTLMSALQPDDDLDRPNVAAIRS